MSSRKTNIAFINGSRADYGLLQSVLRVFAKSINYRTVLIRVGHSLAFEQDFLDHPATVAIKKIYTSKGIHSIAAEVDTAKSVSEIIAAAAEVFSEDRPDFVVVLGDRFETLACVIAAYYQRIPIAHMFGGDRTNGGHLDDNVRHAITKLAHLHFTSCENSYQRVLKLGEEKARVFNVGSTVVDNIRDISCVPPVTERYALMTQHPVTGFPELGYKETTNILRALGDNGIRTFITAPNNEFGSEDIRRAIEDGLTSYSTLSYVGNLGWYNYLHHLKHATFAIGNSSSHLLEAPILGTVSIDVGRRQLGRELSKSVIVVENSSSQIKKAICEALTVSEMPIAHPFGSGGVGEKILSIVDKWVIRSDVLNKSITY